MKHPFKLSSFLIALFAVLLLGNGQALATATLLPNGQQCFQATTGVNGMVGTLGTITGGSGGTTGSYGGVALTGGSGSGATANFTVSGGAVTAVTILNPGSQYVVGDVLSASSASIGNVVGFSVPVNSVAINSSLAGGSVAYYVPNTLTPKQTWANYTQTTLNTNPVTLDANGCATVYGTGMYRQILKDSLGNTVWDKITTDTSSYNNTFWAGLAGGTPNAITLTDPGFNGTDGVVLQFIALSTNTGATTINPSGFGAIPVVKDTTAGPVALTGGEIIQNNVISVLYYATSNTFHLLNTVIATASGAASPQCGASQLVITNDGGAPTSIMDVTIGQLVTQNSAGLVLNRSSVSSTFNISLGTGTATAGGMDGENPSGTAQWIYLWGIDNGSAPSVLGSLSSSAPNLPSGYTYKCRLGAVSVTSAAVLFKQTITGQNGHWVGGLSGSNAPCYVADSAGTVGTYSTTSPTLVAETVRGNGFCVPPTATAANITVSATGNTELGPSSAYSGTNNGPRGSNGLVYPFWNTTAGTATTSWLTLEGDSVYWATNNAGDTITVRDWKDAVNAN